MRRSTPELPTAFPNGGFWVLNGGQTHVVVRCGTVGQNGNGGHSHNDLMSYELSMADPILVDSGTYSYTFDPEARNHFRRTAAHNTVMVDDLEINPVDDLNLFRLSGYARPQIEKWIDTASSTELIAAHDGYRRLSGGVRHRRSFNLDKSSGRLNVVDELLGGGRHRAALHLHLTPGARICEQGAADLVLSGGGTQVRLQLTGFDRVELTEDWVSDRYGVRRRAPLIVGHIEGALPVRFAHSWCQLPLLSDPGRTEESRV